MSKSRKLSLSSATTSSLQRICGSRSSRVQCRLSQVAWATQLSCLRIHRLTWEASRPTTIKTSTRRLSSSSISSKRRCSTSSRPSCNSKSRLAQQTPPESQVLYHRLLHRLRDLRRHLQYHPQQLLYPRLPYRTNQHNNCFPEELPLEWWSRLNQPRRLPHVSPRSPVVVWSTPTKTNS